MGNSLYLFKFKSCSIENIDYLPNNVYPEESVPEVGTVIQLAGRSKRSIASSQTRQ